MNYINKQTNTLSHVKVEITWNDEYGSYGPDGKFNTMKT